MNLGLLVSIYSGGVLGKAMHVGQGEFENMPKLVIVASVMSLVLIPLLGLVPKKKKALSS
ncbi:hypothetical protein HC823_00730 [Candidatus Gracilibacteria bacterium]|nr:hypothetical protein [Candidatus Gracilibacteria bacterium]